jgi:hypothetical protein
MATHSVAKAAHRKTLTGTTVDTVNFTGSADKARVWNFHASEYLWVRTDGVDPTVDGDGTEFVGPGLYRTFGLNTETPSVRVKGDGNMYTVEEA